MVINDLIDHNFLDEERYARSYARGKFRIKQWGRVKITGQLKAKQVSEYCIRKAMTEIQDDEYEIALRQVLEKEHQRLSSRISNSYELKQKIYTKGIRQGYESYLISALIPEILD